MTRSHAFVVALAATALVAPGTALAWKHTGFVWTAEQFPITFFVADDPEAPNFPDGTCQPGVRSGQCRAATEWAAQSWEAVTCTDLAIDIAPEPIPNAHVNRNGRTEVVFNDPNSVIDGPSILAVSMSQGSGATYEVNGTLYNQLDDADIIFKRDGEFVSDADILAGQCGGRTSFDNTLLHEMGHSLGLGHSCEDGDICTDPDLRDATMFWVSPGPCDLSASTLNVDDEAGIRALYGPYATFACNDEGPNGAILAVAPYTLNCGIVTDRTEDVTGTEWGFGDGQTGTGNAISHEYTEPGNYTVTLTVTGESDECVDEDTGEITPWSYSFRRAGYLTVCDIVQGEFTVEPVENLTYQMLNESDVSVYGCITDISWSVYEGDAIEGEPVFTSVAWEPRFDFPEKGTYTVVMNLGGPAGTSGAALTFDVTDSGRIGEGGCSTGGAAAAWTLGLVGAGLLARRRRR